MKGRRRVAAGSAGGEGPWAEACRGDGGEADAVGEGGDGAQRPATLGAKVATERGQGTGARMLWIGSTSGRERT